mgnify:CR=1 FL=1
MSAESRLCPPSINTIASGVCQCLAAAADPAFAHMSLDAEVKGQMAVTREASGATLVYGLIWIGLAIVASIPFGLGWIVLAPVMAGSWYASWRETFDA